MRKLIGFREKLFVQALTSIGFVRCTSFEECSAKSSFIPSSKWQDDNLKVDFWMRFNGYRKWTPVQVTQQGFDEKKFYDSFDYGVICAFLESFCREDYGHLIDPTIQEDPGIKYTLKQIAGSDINRVRYALLCVSHFGPTFKPLTLEDALLKEKEAA